MAPMLIYVKRAAFFEKPASSRLVGDNHSSYLPVSAPAIYV